MMLFRLFSCFRLTLGLIDVTTFLRGLRQIFIIFAMLGLLYSCGSGSTGEDDAAVSDDGASDDGVNDGDDDKGTAIITPPEPVYIGEFSFDAKEYNVAVGKSVNVVISLTGEVPKTAYSITLQEEVNGVAVPNTLINFGPGEATYTYAYDSSKFPIGTVIKLGFKDLPAGYKRAIPDPAIITVEPSIIEFAASGYSVQAGKEADIELIVNKALEGAVDVAIRIADDGEIDVKTVTFPARQKSIKFKHLVASSRLTGTVIRFSIAEAPPGLTLGDQATTQLQVVADPNAPDIVVNFAKSEYSVLAGQESDIEVELTTKLALVGGVTITYEYKADGTTSWTRFPVLFEPATAGGATPKTSSFKFNAAGLTSGAGGVFRMTQDGLGTVALGGVSHQISLGKPDTARVKVIGESLGFKDATLNVNYGEDADVIIRLEYKASAFLNVPLIINSTKADGTADVQRVFIGFERGEQEKTYSYPTATRLAGSDIVFTFDASILSGVGYSVASSSDKSTITLQSDAVSFASSAAENDDVSYDKTDYAVAFKLSKARSNSTNVPLLVTVLRKDGGTSGQIADSVNFLANSTAASFIFNASVNKYEPSRGKYALGDVVKIEIDTAKLAATGLITGSDVAARNLTITGSNTVEFVDSTYELTLSERVVIPIQLKKDAAELIAVKVQREVKDTSGTIVDTKIFDVDFAVGTKIPTAELAYDSTLVTTLGTVTFSFLTVPADIGVTAGKETFVVNVTDTRLNFASPTYSVRSDDAVELEILIGTAATADINIPLIVTKTVPGTTPVVTTTNENVLLTKNATSVKFNYTAPASEVIGTTIEYKIDGSTLPTTAVLGANDTSVITVKADELGFATSTYTIRAGGTLDIELRFAPDASFASYPLVVPINVSTNGGTATSVGSVTFASGDTSKTLSHTAPATAGKQEFSLDTPTVGGVAVTGLRVTSTTELTITDSGIEFVKVTDNVLQNDSVAVTVKLRSKAIGITKIPLNVSATDGSTPGPAEIEFADGEDEKSFSYVASASTAVGTEVTYSFGTLPADVTAVAGAEQTKITVLDASVDFVGAPYTLRGGTTIDIEVELATTATKDVRIPINATGATTATTNVDFAIGEKKKTFSYAAGLTAGNYTLSFGSLPAGVINGGSAAVRVNDPGIQFKPTSYTVRAGDTVDVNVELRTAPAAGSSITVPLIVSPNSAASQNITFTATDTVIFSYTASTNDNQTVSFGTLPAGVVGVIVGGSTSATITVTDSGVDFENSTYDVRAGDTIPITVKLASPATGTLPIPILTPGATTASTSVTFADTEDEKTFNYVAGTTAGAQTVSFDTGSSSFPATGVTAGAGTVVTIASSDVKFEDVPYTVRATDDIVVKVILESAANAPITIPISPSAGTAAPTSVTFPAGTTEQTFTYTAPATDGTYQLRFGAMPTTGPNVTDGGTRDVTVTDSAINFDTSSHVIRSGVSVDIDFTLASDATQEVVIPLIESFTDSSGTGAVTHDITIPAGTARTGTYSFTGPATAGVYTFTFGTLPKGVTAGTAVQSDVTVTDAGVEFGSDTYSVRAGDTVDIEVKLITAPAAGSTITVPVNTPGGAAGSVNVIFNATEISKTFSYAPTATGKNDLTFGTLPTGVTAASGAKTEVTIVDSAINFNSDTYTVRSGATINIEIALIAEATRDVDIPLIETFTDGLGVVNTIPHIVRIANGTKPGTLAYTGHATTGVHSFTFDTANFPAGVSAGAGFQQSDVTVTNAGIKFTKSADSVRAGDTITIKVELESDAIGETIVPLKVDTTLSGSTTTTYQEITFADGDSELTFDYDSTSVAANTSVTYSFDTAGANGTRSFPAGVTVVGATNPQTVITVVDSDIKFDKASDTVRAGDTINIGVTLESDATRDLSIPMYYSFTPPAGSSLSSTVGWYADIAIAKGTKTGSTTYTPANHGSSNFYFSSTALPSGVTIGSVGNSTITVTDPGIEFNATSYDVRAGDDVTISATLATAPVTGETIIVPILIDNDNTAGTLTFNGGGTATYTYTAAATAVASTGKVKFDTASASPNPLFPAGVDAGSDADVTVLDSGIDFKSNSYTVRSGNVVDVEFALVEDATTDVSIPVIQSFTNGISIDQVTHTIVIRAGTRDGKYSFTGPTIPGDYRFTFGTLPTGVRAGTVTQLATVTVIDSGVAFKSLTNTVRATDTVAINVILAAPLTAGTSVTIPLSITYGTNTVTDSVTITAPAQDADYTYTAPATAGVWTLSFDTASASPNPVFPTSLTAGDPASITVTDSAITFDEPTDNVYLGNSVDIDVTLASIATKDVTIPLAVADSTGDITSTFSPAPTITIAKDADTGTYSFTGPATADDYTFTFGTLPAGVTATSGANSVITVSDSSVSFEKASYPVRAGDTATVTVKLGSPALTDLIIPLTVTSGTHPGGGVLADASFLIGEDEKSFIYDASSLTAGTATTYGFGTLPTDLTAGANTTSTVTVTDAGISFDATSYNVRAGDDVTIEATLATAPVTGETIIVPILIDNDNTHGSLTFTAGNPKASYTYTAPATTSTGTVKFDTASASPNPLFPAGVTAGTAAVPVNVLDSSIIFDEPTDDVRAGASINIGVTLVEDATKEVTIPLAVADSTGDITSTFSPAPSITIAKDADKGTYSFTGPATFGDYTFTFGTLPKGVTASTTGTISSVITVGNPGVKFEAASYNVRSGATRDIKVELESASIGAMTIPLSITVGSASPTYQNVYFTDGEDFKIFTHNTVSGSVTAAKGTIITYAFDETGTGGTSFPVDVTVGTTNPQTVVTVTDSDINFDEASYPVRSGATVTVKVELKSPAIGETIVPLKVETSGVAAPTFKNIKFEHGDSEVTFDYTAATSVAVGTTITYSFNQTGTSPAFPKGVTVGSATGDIPQTVITVANPGIEFKKTSYKVREGTTVGVTVRLASPATSNLSIPLTVTSGAHPGTPGTPLANATFAINAQEYTFIYDATSVTSTTTTTTTYGFGDLSAIAGVTVGSKATAGVTVTDPDINFDAASYNVPSGDTVTVGITLDSPAIGETTIPLTVTASDGNTYGPTEIVFADTEDTKTFDYDASGVVPGTSITYDLGTLPAGVSADTVSQTVVIVDNTSVNFEEPTYNVRAGDKVTVTVKLGTNSIGTTTIPLSVTVGGGSPTYQNIEFFDTEDTKTFEYNTVSGSGASAVTAAKDTIITYAFDTAGANGTTSFPAGVTVSSTNATAVVTVKDSVIDFDEDVYNVRAGTSVTVGLTLGSVAIGETIVPLKVDTTLAGSTVTTYKDITFADGAATQTFTYDATSIADGTVISYSFDEAGTGPRDFPVGVSVGTSNATTVVNVTDSDVTFVGAAYNVRAGATRDVIVKLASPAIGQTRVRVNISSTDGALARFENVDFANDEDTKTLTYDTVSGATTVAVGTEITYSFDASLPNGVTAGAITESKITVTNPGIEFTKTSDNVRAGDTVVVTVKLDSPAIGETTIPLTVTASDGNTYGPTEIVFADTEYEQTFTYDATGINAGTTIKYEFGTLPDGVLAGSDDEITLTVTDSAVDFAADTYNVFSGSTVTVTVKLASPAITPLNIPLTVTSGTHSGTPLTNAIFGIDADEYTFTYDATSIADGTTTTYGFGDLSTIVGVTLGTTNSETDVIVGNSDVSFDKLTDNVRAGDKVVVTVRLASPSIGETRIPLTVTTSVGTTAAPADIVFNDTEQTKTFEYNTVSGSGASAVTAAKGTTITYGFGTLPAGLTIGSNFADTTLTVTDSDVYFEAGSYNVRVGDTVVVTVKLASPAIVTDATNPLTIPLTVTASDGNTYGPTEIIFNDTEDTQTFTYTATAAKDTTITYEFDTGNTNFPAGVTATATATTPTTSIVTVKDSAVNFVTPTPSYTVRSGDTVDIELKLESPAIGALSIPISADATDASYSKDFTIDFADTDTNKIYNFDASAIPKDKTILVSVAENTDLPTGVTRGTDYATTITTTDSDIDFDLTADNVPISGTIEVAVTLKSAATKVLTIPLDATDGTVTELSFAIGDTTSSFTYTPPASLGDQTVRFGSSLPVGVTAGAKNAIVLSVVNNTLDFNAATYPVTAGDTATVTVDLAYPAPNDLDVVVSALPASLSIPDTTVSFLKGEKVKTFDYPTPAATDTHITYSFKTIPTELVEGTIKQTVVSAYVPKVLSFTNLTNADLYINEAANIAVETTAAFTVDTTVPVTREAFTVGTSTNLNTTPLTAVFLAGDTAGTITDTAPALAGETDADIRYSFNSTDTNFPFNVTIDSLKTDSRYTVRGYEYEFANLSASGVDQIISAAVGETIYIPILLDAPLKAKFDFKTRVRFNYGSGYDTWKILDYNDFGTVGVAEQVIEHVIPSTPSPSVTDYQIQFKIDDTGQKGIKVDPLVTDDLHNISIVPENVFAFDEKTIEATAGSTIAVKLTLSRPATAPLNVPLIVTDTGGTVTDLGTADFALAADEVTINYDVPATAGEYTISVNETIFTFPADVVVKGIPNHAVVTAVAPRTLSFTTATSTDAYINEDVSLAVDVDVAFTEKTEISVRRSAIGGALLNVTAVFEANATAGTITDTAPAIGIGTSSVKDRTITYSFHTTHHTFPNHTLVDSGKATSSYTAKGYSYQFANLAISGPDQTSNASIGDVIYIPILLDAPLKAPAVISIARTSGGLVAIEHTMDDIGNAEQRVPYTLPDAPATPIIFSIFDIAQQKGMVIVQPAPSRTTYQYQVTGGNEISFDTASHGDITVEEAQDIALSVDIAFGADTTIPLTRTITSLDGVTPSITPITDAVTATFLGSSLTASVDAGTVDATTAPSVKDRKVTFSFNTSHADWAGLNSTIGATNESTYNTLGYEYRFAAEPIPAGLFSSTGYHEGRLANGSTVQVPLILTTPLNKAITLELQVLTSKVGGGYDTDTITMADFGVVGQANQTFPYTLPTTKTAQYDMLFVLVATDLMNIGGGAADPAKVYQYRIDPFVVHPISFDNATYPDVYVGDAQPITLTLETAFPVETKVPLVKNIYGVFINYNVTATFAANSLTASVDAEYIAAPHLKNRTVTYRFDTSHADWIAKDLTAPPFAQSNYLVIGYDYYFPNETGGGTHEALSAQAAAVIDLPFTLTTPLKAQTNFTMEVRHDAGGSFNSWTAVTVDNHGTVNSTAQTFPYQLPNTTDTSYQLEFRLVDTDTHTVYDPGGAADEIFKYAVTTPTARQLTFDTEVYADAYPSTTTDITLTASTQFTTATDVPVIRKIYQPTIGGVQGALISETKMVAKFPANSTAGTITQTSFAYGAGRVVEYSFDTTHANWPAGNVTSSTGFFRSYYKMAAAAQVSFKHASYPDAYIGTQRNIELDSTVAFVQATAIPITRTVTKGTNAPIVTELTAHFNAGSDKGLLQGDERLVPHVKDATVTFTFGTLPAAWIAAHATKTSSSYNALGYTGQIQDDSQSGGGRGIAITATSGAVIQIPILLNEDLQAKTSFNVRIQSRFTAAGTSTQVNSAWTYYPVSNHGIVGQKQQYLSYTLPAFAAGDTLRIAVIPVSTDGVDMIASAGNHSSAHYDVEIPPSAYVVKFDGSAPAGGADFYIGADIPLSPTVNKPFATAVDVPLEVSSADYFGDFIRAVATSNAVVRFEPGQTTGRVIDNSGVVHEDGRVMRYTLRNDTTAYIHLTDYNGVDVNRSANVSEWNGEYIMRIYSHAYPGNNAIETLDMTVPSGGTVQIPVILDKALLNKTSFSYKARVTVSGTRVVNNVRQVIHNHGIVGQAEQYLPYTLPNFSATDTVELILFLDDEDVAFMGRWHGLSNQAQGALNINVTPLTSYNVHFDSLPAGGYKGYVNSTPDITLTVDHAFSERTDLPVFRTVDGVVTNNTASPEIFARFEAGATTGKIIDNLPFTHVTGADVDYVIASSELPAQNGIPVNAVGVLNATYYTMTDYELKFDPEEGTNYSGRKQINVAAEGTQTVTVPYTLDEPLKAKATMRFQYKHDASGSWTPSWHNVTFPNHGVVGQTAQSITITVPADTQGDGQFDLNVQDTGTNGFIRGAVWAIRAYQMQINVGPPVLSFDVGSPPTAANGAAIPLQLSISRAFETATDITLTRITSQNGVSGTTSESIVVTFPANTTSITANDTAYTTYNSGAWYSYTLASSETKVTAHASKVTASTSRTRPVVSFTSSTAPDAHNGTPIYIALSVSPVPATDISLTINRASLNFGNFNVGNGTLTATITAGSSSVTITDTSYPINPGFNTLHTYTITNAGTAFTVDSTKDDMVVVRQ